MSADVSAARASGSRRGRLIAYVFLAAALSYVYLGLTLGDLLPGEGGRGTLLLFLEGAIRPAIDYQAAEVPPGTPPFLLKVLIAVRDTLVFAAAGISLSLLFGVVLGFLGSTAWWSDEGGCANGSRGSFTRCYALPAMYAVVRVVIGFMRSIHELLWAVLFLAAFGLSSFSAVAAIAIPYGGTLAKVFSEMLDEAPRGSMRSLRAIGARPALALFFGLVPRALPDVSAYAFYRFECAIRSSAILGFFGYPTLGYYLKLSAENLHYGEVWTYLYALCVVGLVMELWSGKLRRRMTVR